MNRLMSSHWETSRGLKRDIEKRRERGDYETGPENRGRGVESQVARGGPMGGQTWYRNFGRVPSQTPLVTEWIKQKVEINSNW